MDEALNILEPKEPKSTTKKRKAQSSKTAGETRSLLSEEKSETLLTKTGLITPQISNSVLRKRSRVPENGVPNVGEVFPNRLRNAFFTLSDNRLTSATNLITNSTFENFWRGIRKGIWLNEIDKRAADYRDVLHRAFSREVSELKIDSISQGKWPILH
jgi:hypothetical protein